MTKRFWLLTVTKWYVKMYGHIIYNVQYTYLPTYVFFSFPRTFSGQFPRCSINVLRVHGFHFNDLGEMDTALVMFARNARAVQEIPTNASSCYCMYSAHDAISLRKCITTIFSHSLNCLDIYFLFLSIGRYKVSISSKQNKIIGILSKLLTWYYIS